jgi:hypothetical protein
MVAAAARAKTHKRTNCDLQQPHSHSQFHGSNETWFYAQPELAGVDQGIVPVDRLLHLVKLRTRHLF